MGKIAFLYPRQGAQRIGMGKELLEIAPDLFARYLARCDEVAALPVTTYCLEGPVELLNQPQVAQPALFAYSLALTDYARQSGLAPDFVAGHGLGEYTAAVAAGTLSFEEGLYLVCQRGKLMYQAQDQQPGAMVAVIGLPQELLYDLCADISKQYPVAVTHWDAPTRFVVSGVEAGVLQLMAIVRSYKHARAVRLVVRGAFHSSLMTPVQAQLRPVVESLTWSNASVPLAANVSGRLLVSGQDISQELIEQITNPIQWVACVKTLLEAGCETFIEPGPGQVLTRLVRAIAPGVRACAVDTPQKVAALAQSLRGVAYA